MSGNDDEYVYCSGCDEYCFKFLPTVKHAIEDATPELQDELYRWMTERILGQMVSLRAAKATLEDIENERLWSEIYE